MAHRQPVTFPRGQPSTTQCAGGRGVFDGNADIVKKFREEARQEGLQEGLQEGRQQGRQLVLIDVYRARFRTMPRDLQTIVKRTEDEAVLRSWVQIFATRSAAEIAVALRGR